MSSLREIIDDFACLETTFVKRTDRSGGFAFRIDARYGSQLFELTVVVEPNKVAPRKRRLHSDVVLPTLPVPAVLRELDLHGISSLVITVHDAASLFGETLYAVHWPRVYDPAKIIQSRLWYDFDIDYQVHSDQCCGICLGSLVSYSNNFVAPKQVGETDWSCCTRHEFHEQCLERWAQVGSGCPMCRQ